MIGTSNTSNYWLLEELIIIKYYDLCIHNMYK